MAVDPVAPTKANINERSDTEIAIMYDKIKIETVIPVNLEFDMETSLPLVMTLSTEFRQGCACNG